MITYTSLDIIKRAMELADLENSDFISFREKLSALNEAYTTVYQKALDIGTNSFVKKIEISERAIQLPEDFYQLKAVYLKTNDFNRVPILRRPINQSTGTLSYDMENGNITINGQNGGSFIIEYYPVPVSLTFPNEKKKVTTDYDIIDAYDDLFLTVEEVDIEYSSPEGTYTQKENRYVVKSFTDTDIDIVIYAIGQHTGEDTDFYPIYMDKEYVVFYNADDFFIFNINNGDWDQLSRGAFCPIVYKEKLLVYNDADKEVTLFHGNKVFNYDIQNFEDTMCAFLDNSMQNITVITMDPSTSELILKRNETTLTLNRQIHLFCIKDETLYVFTDSDYFVMFDIATGMVEEFYKDEVYIKAVSFNDDNGYGYLTSKYMKKYMTSFFENTILNFPNNMYFNYMSYLLAMLFKQKQGGDITTLASLAATAEETFINSLPVDRFGSVRITNVY